MYGCDLYLVYISGQPNRDLYLEVPSVTCIWRGRCDLYLEGVQNTIFFSWTALVIIRGKSVKAGNFITEVGGLVAESGGI